MYLLEMLYGTSCNNHYRSSYAFLLLLFLRRPGNNQVQSGSVLEHHPRDTEILCDVTHIADKNGAVVDILSKYPSCHRHSQIQLQASDLFRENGAHKAD